MASVATLPVEQLLAPIAGDAPCGKKLRGDEVDLELRNLVDRGRVARAAWRKASEAGEDPFAASLSDWRAVQESATQLLQDVSKDLEVASLLAEALVRTTGFFGLAESLEVTAGLVWQYWPAMLERARSGGGDDDHETIATLVRPLDQWKDVLTAPIAWIPLTGGGSGAYALWQFEQAAQADKLESAERDRRKAITSDQFLQSAAATANSQPEFYTALMNDVVRAVRAVEAVDAAFDQHLTGPHAGLGPGLTKVKERLEDAQRCIQHVAGDHLQVPAENDAGDSPLAADQPDRPRRAAAAAGELADREQAFRELLRIADFFARTEPLSLLAEQIRQVVHRGRLAPDKYYSELIDNEDTLKQFFRLVGIRRRDENGDSS